MRRVNKNIEPIHLQIELDICKPSSNFQISHDIAYNPSTPVKREVRFITKAAN